MPNARPVVSDRIEWYPSATAAAMAVGVTTQALVQSIKRGGECANRSWYYDDSGKIGVMTREERARLRRLSEMRRNPQDARHGTLTGYSLGCRCVACKMARSMRDKTMKVMS